MNRKSFFAALFGGAGAAQAQVVERVCLRVPSCGIVVNNQCPVCGEMAPPFKPTIEEWRALSPCAPAQSVGGMALANCRAWSKEDLPKEQRIDCERCNTTFRQRAE